MQSIRLTTTPHTCYAITARIVFALIPATFTSELQPWHGPASCKRHPSSHSWMSAQSVYIPMQTQHFDRFSDAPSGNQALWHSEYLNALALEPIVQQYWFSYNFAAIVLFDYANYEPFCYIIVHCIRMRFDFIHIMQFKVNLAQCWTYR